MPFESMSELASCFLAFTCQRRSCQFSPARSPSPLKQKKKQIPPKPECFPQLEMASNSSLLPSPLSPKSKTSGLSGDCRGGNPGSHLLPGQSLNQPLPFFLTLTTLMSSTSCDASCYPLSRLPGSRVDRPDPWQWTPPHPYRSLGPGFLFSILAYLLSILPPHISAYSSGKRR